MKYLNFKFTVTADFSADITLPTLTGSSGVTFDILEPEMWGSTLHFTIRPRITVGAQLYNLKVALNNSFISDLSTAIELTAIFKDGGHGAFQNVDIRDTLTAESVVNIWDEYPTYNSYRGSYNTQLDCNIRNCTAPASNGQTVMTIEFRYQFDESTEMQLYTDMLAMYPGYVKAWAPGQGDSLIYIGDTNISKIYCGNTAVSAVYVGDNKLFP